MKDEFDKIFEYFSMPPEERAKHLDEILEDSIGFFERFKHIMLHGTPEEKQALLQKVQQLQAKMQEETQKISKQTGMSDKELKEFIDNPENFSEEQWEVIQNAKNRIEEEAAEIKEILHPEEEKGEKGPKKPPKKKKRQDWMKS